MHMTVIALIISILGLCLSFFLVGGLVCAVTFILGMRLFLEEKSIPAFRVVAISAAGIIIPFVMYFNTFGFALPQNDGSGRNIFVRIIETNYANLGFNIGKRTGDLAAVTAGNGSSVQGDAQGRKDISGEGEDQAGKDGASSAINAADGAVNAGNIAAVNGVDIAAGNTGGIAAGNTGNIEADSAGGSAVGNTGDIAAENTGDTAADGTSDKTAGSGNSIKDSGKDLKEKTKIPEGSIFESLDSIKESQKNKGGIVSIAPSDDDMPSYGGLPVGTLLIAQYFREDDHNCNPVLVLQNKTGGEVRYECRFIARSSEGEELSESSKTVEVVRDGALFVFEGRFDKRELGGRIPDSYEFSITKRKPYETDLANQVSVYTATEGASALLTAENNSDKKVKVDAYVLFFDGEELVDCMWMIPQNTDEVCLEPGSAATIKGDAYYRFDRVETFYTAYEALGE